MVLSRVASQWPLSRYRRGLFFRILVLGLGLLAQTGSAQPPSKLVTPTNIEKEINRFVGKTDLKTLLGQTLMVGVQDENWSRANERLTEMVRTYHLGGVLLFDGNFPPQHERESNDIETPAAVAALTRKLQDAAQRPLLVAMDQEGGSRMVVNSGATRIASPVFLGNARSEPLARRAGEVIGSEMKALGVNTVFAPVADVNNNAQNDIIGQRAFGAHPELVAPLAAAFARGLRQAGVLAVAKHYPGHGTSSEDPHFEISRQGYDEISQLDQSDLPPFKRLAAEGVDGVMTAHILSPIDALPVTISGKAINMLRRDPKPGLLGLGFRGVVFTDDLSSMMGILSYIRGKTKEEPIGNKDSVLARAEVARRALEAGSDVLLFGQLWLEEDKLHPERSLTLMEFQRIYEHLWADFSKPGRRAILERSVERILVAKARLVDWRSEDRSAWQTSWNEKNYRELLEKNRPVAVEIARRSAVLIREFGRTIDVQKPPNYFAFNKGPLSKGVLLLSSEGAQMTVVDPVFKPNKNSLYEAIVQDAWLPQEHITQVPLVYGWRSEEKLKEASKLWGFKIERLSKRDDFGKNVYLKDAISRKADQILARSTESSVIVFGVLLREHVEVLREVCHRLRADQKIVVVLFLEPYFLVSESNPLELYDQTNAIFLYVSPNPDLAMTSKFLYGETDWVPHDVSYLSVPLPKIANRGETLGAAIEMETTPISPTPPPTPSPTPPPRQRPHPDGPSIGVVLVVIVVALLAWRYAIRSQKPSTPHYPFALPEANKNNQWYSYGREDIVIVFVHGVLSDSRSCWLFTDPTGRKLPEYWPHLVQGDQRFGNPSIYLGGFYTEVDSGPFEISDCADQLLRALSLPGAEGSPQRVIEFPRIVFVCHSMGGIVVRYLLERNVEQFENKQIGLVLLASPSLGAQLAKNLDMLVRFFQQTQGRQLQWGSWTVSDLDGRFKDLVCQRRLPGLRGIEAVENHFVFRRKWLPPLRVVVSKESAGRYFGEAKRLPGTDHFSIVKPDSASHPAHELLVDFWASFCTESKRPDRPVGRASILRA